MGLDEVTDSLRSSSFGKATGRYPKIWVWAVNGVGVVLGEAEHELFEFNNGACPSTHETVVSFTYRGHEYLGDPNGCFARFPNSPKLDQEQYLRWYSLLQRHGVVPRC